MVFFTITSIIILNMLICFISQISVGTVRAAGTETLIGITGNGFVLLAADMGISSNGVAFTSTHADKIHQLLPNALIAAVGDAADTDRIVSLLRAECNVYTHENFGSSNDGVEVINCSTIKDKGDERNSTETPLLFMSSDSPSSLLSVECIAEMARHKVAEHLRSSNRLRVCGLIAGMKRKHSDISELYIRTVAQHIQHHLLTANLSLQKTYKVQECEPQIESKPKVSSFEPSLFWLDEYGSLVENVPYGVHGYASDMLWSILDNGYKPNMTLSKALELAKECIHQLKTRYVINSQSQKFCIKYLDDHGCHTIDIGSAE